VPALDGLRGVAVAGVLLFHGGHLAGGYLGVDLFFVLSGFLITTLLLVEAHDRAGIGLGGFWARRARRLLPALGGVLVGVGLYCLVFADASELARIRGDVLATIAYVANWRDVFASQDYWALFRAPSPLEHTWSLAIEEQFYLVWPLVFVGLLAWWKRNTPKAVLVTALLGAVTSTALMFTLYDAADPSRVYYGTDTRATGILLGGALAAALVIWGPVRSRAARIALEIAGLAGIALLAVAWTRLGGQSDRLYRGGFVVCAIAAVAVIAAASHPRRGIIAASLSWRPLCLLGIISYGVYLWHWPVDITLSADRTGITGWPLFFLQFAVTLAIATASFVLLEQPIRRGALSARQWSIVTPVAAAVLVALAVVSTTGGSSSAASGGNAPAAESRRPTSELGRRVGPVLLVGDSVAVSMTDGLRNAGLDLTSSAFPGCKIVKGTIRITEGDERDDDCPWAVNWAQALRDHDPDVVLLESAAFELWDVKPPGSSDWLVPGTPEWADHWRANMQQAVDTLTSTGAYLVVANIACSDPPEGTTDAIARRSAFNPARVEAGNDVLEELAAENADRMKLVDLHGYLCPGGRYHSALHGVDPVRTDGVHLTPAGSDLVGRWLAPQLVRPDRARQEARPQTGSTS